MVAMFFGIAILWIIIGVLVFLVTMILNTGSDEKGSPKEEPPAKEEGFFSSFIKALTVFIQWPLLAIMTIRALKNHRTPKEQAEADIKALDARATNIANSLVEANLTILEGKKPLGVKWVKKSDYYLRQALFVVGFNGIPIITHYIRIKGWWNVECFRGLPDSPYQKQIGKFRSVKKAQNWCEKDQEWLDVCTTHNLQTSDPSLIKFLEEMSNEN